MALSWTPEGFDPAVLFKAVERASSLGASYAEARLHVNFGYSLSLLNDNLMGGGPSYSGGIAVRVVVDGSLGFASTSKWDERSVIDAVERAVKSARSLAGAARKVSMSEETLGRASYEVKVREKPWEVEFDDKLSRIKEVSKSLEAKGIEITSKVLHYSDSAEYKYLVTSDGSEVESLVPRVEVFYNISARYGGEMANKWGEVGGSGGLEALEKLGLQRRIADDLESLRVALTRARNPPKGVMDVIISPEIVGLALHESIGHPSEADRVLGREAAQAGRSYREYTSGRIGSEIVTVIDDPTIPGSSGFYLYDDEAVPARPRRLIDRGVLAEMLHNRETAAEMGVKSNAAARARDYRSEPIVRMANTYLAPGDYTFDELVESVKEGVYIKTYMEWNIDEWRLTARYVGLEAYIVRNGRLEEPVKNVVLQIPTTEFYSKIDAVGRDLAFYPGMCGKGEPMQPLPVWMGGPHVRLRGVRVG